MLNIKKISPTEFRLHNKLFYVAYSPNNYFESFRFEILFQYLLMWFFHEFGIYFYIQKLKLIDDTILFQLYYYKTYMVLANIQHSDDFRFAGDVSTLQDYPDLFKSTTSLRYYNRNLLEFFLKRKSNKKTYTVNKKKVAATLLWKKHKNHIRPKPAVVYTQHAAVDTFVKPKTPTPQKIVIIDMELQEDKHGKKSFKQKATSHKQSHKRNGSKLNNKPYSKVGQQRSKFSTKSGKNRPKRPWYDKPDYTKKKSQQTTVNKQWQKKPENKGAFVANKTQGAKNNRRPYQKKPYTPRWIPRQHKKANNSALVVKRTTPAISFNFFFTYFFLHFFKYSSVILYKSLYKMVFSNQIYKMEHSKLLYKTRYMQNSIWTYDLYFFLNYALTFANTTFLFPYFVYHLTETFKQKRTIIGLFNLLRAMYFYKRNIRGIKILVNGPYDRHGRSRHLVLKIGDISLIEYRSYIMYDSIQCPTLYGTINLKFWVHYTDANVDLNIANTDVALPRKTS